MLNQRDIGGIEITFENLAGVDGGLLCDLTGVFRLEPEVEESFREFFLEHLRNGIRFFVLDCSNLSFDSYFRVDFLFAAFHEIRMVDGDLILLGFPELTLPFKDPELGFPFKRVSNLAAALVELGESKDQTRDTTDLKAFVNSLANRLAATETYYTDNARENPKMQANLRAVAGVRVILSQPVLTSELYVDIQDTLTSTEMWEFHAGPMWREFIHVLGDLIFYKLNHPKIMSQALGTLPSS